MSDSVKSPDLASRIAELSPEKQALLARKLAAKRATETNGGAAGGIPRADVRDSAPLSTAQQGVWTAEQRTPDTAAYNVPFVLRVRGPLDIDALEGALAALVARHEILRTTFEERGGEAEQVVHASVAVPLQRVDLRADPARLDETLRATVRTPFVLTRAPLLRSLVAQTGDAEYVVAIVAHHLIFDGGSEALFKRDLAAAYDAIVAGNAPKLAPLSIEFADFARWERAQLDGPRLETQLAYWRATLGGAPTAIDLPSDRSTDAARDVNEAARVVTTFPPALADAVARTARAHDATTFMVLLAGFQALLARFSRQEDLVVGVPVSGRDRPETQALIGFLANTLPVRATVNPGTSFSALVGQMRERTLGAFAHAAVPIERLAAELGQGALFDTLFVLQDGTSAPLRLADCEVESVAVEIGAAKVDLSLSMSASAQGLRAALIHRTSRFSRETAERLLEYFGRLLASLCEDPSRAIIDVPLLGEADRATLAEWNGTRVDYPLHRTLVDLIDDAVERSPDAPAVAGERETLSYAALDARATALATELRARGVGTGTLVGVYAERSVAMVIGLLAVLKAGGAYVPIDPEYPVDRVAYMLEDSGVRVLLTQSHLAAGLPPHKAQVLLLDDARAAGDVAPLDVLAGPDDAAYMIYTSGSTGRPKGALNAHRGIVNRLLWMQSEYRLTPADVVLQKTPFSFDVSVWEFFWPLLAGAKLVMARPGGHRDPAYLVDTIATHGVTVCHFVPSMLREFLSHPDVGRCTSLRDVMASGEALSPDLVAAFQRELPNARLHNLYGPTECAVDVTYWPCPSGPGTSAPQLVPIGRPVANTQIHVLDAKLHALPIGVAGELYIGGDQVGIGYHGRPELTAERFVPDPFTPGGRLYRTGDLARWRTDGTVEYLGRLDFQVKLRGYRIELGEIEQRLAALPGVHGALVTLSEDAALGARLVGYYVAPADGLSPDLAAAELRRDLPDFMVPSALVRLDAWPLSPNGKVDRRALPVPDGGAVAEDAGVAPRTAVERVLCRLLGDALGRAPLGVTTDFFAIGGHSLLATRVVSQASRLFRASLTLRGFFAAPSAAGLAEAVTGVLGGAQAERIATLVEKVQSMSPEDRERLRREQASRTEQA